MNMHHRRGRNVWHSDGRPAGYGMSLRPSLSPAERLGRRIAIGSVAIALFAILYFGAQLLRTWA